VLDLDKIFREYDIRGVVGTDLDEGFAFSLGKAFGSLLKKVNAGAKYVSVGRDARVSSEALAANIIKGIISTGLDVCDIGLCPTPLQYFSIHRLNLDGGIMVTGSHNPPEYNWKTGHSLVKDKMRKEGALLAGEFSGHIFISDGYFGFDDVLYTTFRLVEIMKTAALGINE
jgi:phosphomannomutase